METERTSDFDFEAPSPLVTQKRVAMQKIFNVVDAAMALNGGRSMHQRENDIINNLYLKIDACNNAEDMKPIINMIDILSENVLSHVPLNDKLNDPNSMHLAVDDKNEWDNLPN